MVDYVAIGNVPAEEIFGSEENLALLLHGMNCYKKICLIIAALEKVGRGVEWVWNENFPLNLAKRVAELVAEKLSKNIRISFPDLTEYVLREVYDKNDQLKEGLE